MKTKHFLLCCIAVLCSISTFAHDFEEGGIYYNLLGGDSVSITYEHGSYLNNRNRYTGDFTIPDMVTHNEIPYRVTAIGEDAFRYCSNLTSITIPNSITTIDDYAFCDCNNLTSVQIPSSVVYIGNAAFKSCSNLQYNTYDNAKYLGHMQNPYHALITSTSTSITSCSIHQATKLIAGGAFRSSNLTNVSIPDSITTIGNEAFRGCLYLRDVIIPKGIVVIGDYAFSHCQSLTLSNSNITIGNNAFSSVNTLTCYSDIPPIIQENTFSNESCVAYVPKYSINIYKQATNWTGIDIQTLRFDSNGYYNILGGDSVEITFGKKYSNDFTIPSSVDHNGLTYRVTAIGEKAFRECSSLSSVTIPNSVTTIGYSAFKWCSGLKTITFSDNIISIGDSAFYDCDSLTSVTIPNNVRYIEDHAFEECYNLTTITIPNNVKHIGKETFKSCTSLASVVWNATTCWDCISSPFASCNALLSIVFGENVEYIPAYLCYNLKNLSKIIIPNMDVVIGEYAFANCPQAYNSFDNAKYLAIGTNKYHTLIEAKDKSITSCFIYPTTKIINESAFANCSSLTVIDLPTTITTIGEYAFSYCSSLTNISLNNNLTTISNAAFRYCSSLTEVTIPNSVTSIGDGAFLFCENLTKTNYMGDLASWCAIDFGNEQSNPVYYSHKLYINDIEVNEVIIPDGVTAIGAYTFTNSHLSSITIPNSVISIGRSAFNLCKNLTSVTLGNSITTIGRSAFYNCSNLTEIIIPNSVTSIGVEAFYYCENLTNVMLGNNLTTIDRSAFSYCAKLTEIIIPNNVTTIGEYAFDECSNLTDVTIGENVTTIGTGVFCNCSKLDSVIWKAKNCSDFTLEDTPFYYSNNSAINFDLRSQITSFTFGENVEYIPAYLCDGMNLTSITLPNSITNIGSSVFAGCSKLKFAKLSNNLASISDSAFSDCKALISMQIPNSVTHIGQYAFNNCSKLKYIKLSDKVETIGKKAFYKSDLEYLILPQTVISIDSFAFDTRYDMSAVKIESVIPPTCIKNAFGIGLKTQLFVPCGSLDAYLEDQNWTFQFDEFVESNTLFLAISADTYKGEVVTMLNPTCDDPMAMMRVVPHEGYKFMAWSDGNTETIRTIEEVTEDIIYTAYFAAINGIFAPTAKDSVNIEATTNTAGFTWQPNEDAYTYSLGVFNDAAMTDTVCKMTFDAQGNMLTKETVEPQYAPRRKVQQEVSALNFVVTDLEESTIYTYMLRSHDCNNMILATEIGTFQTASSAVTEITDVVSEKTDSVQKILENGTIYILKPNGEKYTIDGIRVM